MNIPQEEIERYADDPLNWRYDKIKERRDEYSIRKDVNMLLVTYNINEKIIKKETFEYILEIKEYQIDMIFIVVEEIDMSVSGFLKGNTLSLKARNLAQNIQEALKNIYKEEYKQVYVSQLGGVCIIGFVRKEMENKIKQFASGYEAVGAMGMANKGGIAISFEMYDTTICLVGSHLAAHQPEINKRNRNFSDIYNNIKLIRTEEGEQSKWNKIEGHDIIFWMGDLNYRIDEEDSIIRERINKGSITEIIKEKDQLKVQQKHNELLGKFKEAEIEFEPTYKFYPNTQNYSEKRKPAYCDRILYKECKGLEIKCLKYISKKEAIESDHKPVIGCYSVETRSIIKEKYTLIEKELIEMENKLLRIVRPSVKINKQEFIVEIYPYKQTEVTLLVQNDGNAKTSILFRDHQIEKAGGYPDWLHIEPQHLEISKNDFEPKSITFYFQFNFIDTSSLFKNGSFDYNLILEIQGGKSLFITFKLVLLQTSFGKSIDDLNLHPNGYILSQPQAYTPLVIPKEIWRLCDYVLPFMHDPTFISLSHPSIDYVPIYYEILHSLDTHSSFNPSLNYHRVLEFLLIFLVNLNDSIIPSSLYEHVILSADKPDVEIDKFFIRNNASIPNSHYNLFIYLLSFIKEILRQNSSLHPEDLIKYFSSSFVRPKDGFRRQCDSKTIEQFLLKFIKK
ncbi:hypothetical protein ENUP19_0242G0018 [Entamoeba nuttalli]|nr:inositol polyphosphate 5-phosphatase, putative [Entamoeba nuttalli P19]EKE39974.1 inositol polyphosphate 5-phosphatase, putative [Entamoeba nuttalli P19]|eukprot:XP_008857691.1 inositol polyphosphate 5-phosphatase, putative [Entamoeba nuttalli P19]